MEAFFAFLNRSKAVVLLLYGPIAPFNGIFILISSLIHWMYVSFSTGIASLGRDAWLSYFYTDRSNAVLLLWFLTVTCSCCPYLYFGSAIMLVTYFVNFR